MSDFEYVVGFYALLLGLAVANVVIAFADMWRERETKASGWCAPLLAGTVLLGAMNVWLATWATRNEITVDAWQMIAALGICLPYVFVSRAMTPPDQATIGAEDHYLNSIGPILGALALSPAIAVWTKIRLDHFHLGQFEELWLLARLAVPLALMATASRMVHRLGLGLINVILIAGLFRFG